MKTGSTIPSLLAAGEDFEGWFVHGSGEESGLFHCSAIDLGQDLPDLDTTMGIIITGSPAYVTDLAPWNYLAADFLRDAHARQVPILGVCYGHQLLAWAFAGEVGFHPEGREIGTVDVSLTAAAASDALFADMEKKFKAQVSHQQSVLRLPEEAVLLAQNNFEANHAFRLGATTWGIQFHPEFTGDIVKAYIRERQRDIDAEGLDSQRLLEEVTETPHSASLLRRFMMVVRTQQGRDKADANQLLRTQQTLPQQAQ